MGVDSHEDYIAKVGKLDADVKNLKDSFETFAERFEGTVTRLFNKLEEHQKETAPKPLSIPLVLSMGVSSVGILGGIFATVIYIVTSSNAPIVAQQSQISSTLTNINAIITKLNGDIQLTNKETSVIKGKATSNEETLQWILFDENIPKQITELKKDVEFLKKGAR